jgi:hypothetical protein
MKLLLKHFISSFETAGFSKGIGLLGWGFFISTPTYASTVCDFYKKYAPLIYDINCNRGPTHAKKNTGSGASTFGSAFNINPSSVPTEPSPYGLETIQSAIPPAFGEKAYTFSLIKGFHKFGSAVTTGNNNTFYGNDIVQRSQGYSTYDTFAPSEPAKGTLPSFNVGTAFSLLENKSIFNVAVSLGLSARYNHITNTMGGGMGLMIKSDYLILGAGFVNERVSNYYPQIAFYSATVGLRLLLLDLEYTYLQHSGGVSLGPVQIVTMTYTVGPIILTYALRWLDFYYEGQVAQGHFALQCQFSKHLSLGVMQNYIPGANSIAVQIFL